MESTTTKPSDAATSVHTDCDKVVKILDMIVDGEASPEDKTYFYSHVEGCVECFEVYNKEAQLKRFLQDSIKRKAVPAHLTGTIKDLIHSLPATV